MGLCWRPDNEVIFLVGAGARETLKKVDEKHNDSSTLTLNADFIIFIYFNVPMLWVTVNPPRFHRKKKY
jgi:hypothetical protein